ncbi:MAG: hypothetical protein LBI30_01815 [Holosporales bacterium]|jgi:hypothetical protein|nr:hypothetical protein [Holosporales bacterium]
MMINYVNSIPDPDSEEYSIYTEESAIDIVQELESYLRENLRVRFCIEPSWMN